MLPTEYTAMATANPQPAVMTIQPPFCPLVRLSTTLATTPSPSRTRSIVPISSARSGDIGAGEVVRARSWAHDGSFDGTGPPDRGFPYLHNEAARRAR